MPIAQTLGVPVAQFHERIMVRFILGEIVACERKETATKRDDVITNYEVWGDERLILEASE